MVPSSSNVLSAESTAEAMDFQQSSFATDLQNQQQQSHYGEASRPQQQHHLQQHSQSQAQASPLSFHADSYQSLHQSHQAFGSAGQQQQYQQQQQQQQRQNFPQQPSFSGDSFHPQSVFAGDLSSQRQHPPNGDPRPPSQQQQHPPHHAQRDSFASMTNAPPPASTSGSSSQAQAPHEPTTQAPVDPQFDIFEWYPNYQSCQRYFADHAQHSGHVQAVAAFINIALPFQRPSPPRSTIPTTANPSSVTGPSPRSSPPQQHQASPSSSISLIPYLRRLVVTGLDFPGVLHGFFGDDWVGGVGPLHEQERRNYLFAAKSGGWASVKKDYDMLPLETVPFMRPLQGPVIAEIEAAEKSWSEWLAMEDWMVGPRAPEGMAGGNTNANARDGSGASNPSDTGNVGTGNVGSGGGGSGSGHEREMGRR